MKLHVTQGTPEITSVLVAHESESCVVLLVCARQKRPEVMACQGTGVILGVEGAEDENPSEVRVELDGDTWVTFAEASKHNVMVACVRGGVGWREVWP